jgi:hypothetical protein
MAAPDQQQDETLDERVQDTDDGVILHEDPAEMSPEELAEVEEWMARRSVDMGEFRAHAHALSQATIDLVRDAEE